MGAYYYLAAQLPYLIYGQEVPMSSGAFRELARNAMDPGEAKVLDLCTIEPDAGDKTSSDFINNWHQWEEALRLNLARSRSQNLKRENTEQRIQDTPEYPSDAAAAAKAVLSMDSPLEAEIFLDRARWSAIENLSGINYFSENTIYAYLLKLLLMERRQAFNTEEGFTEYKTLYASILENAGEPI